MSREGDSGGGGTGGSDSDWPVELSGVVESVVTTLGPNDRWNVAALGLHAGDPVTARTYGRTRTRRNFRERGGGVVQFTRDPVDFVDAALSVREGDEPVLDSADAWVEVEAERVGTDREGDTEVVTWALRPVDGGVERRVVPTTNRGFYAVVEATVAASRLDVAGYDRGTLLDRLAYFERVVETAGGERERAAFERIDELVDAKW
ncbi:DUF447 domain-containing protein [Halosimplex pelagicum]|uniref:DUF447 family protein n=1 Tax=Halosimplex pelagicum TaxID=869886 RepID=A0A7D5PCC8_9EURY|nr:DUF447 domain-containing protein [Halosimplex pelagicum]QLH84544.1 DUF447 family protein [Halosimplex pelagicum]